MKGLPNFGNTCYLNSILQILFNTPGFYDVFMRYSRPTDSMEVMSNQQALVYKFRDLFTVYRSDAAPEILRDGLRDFVHCFQTNYAEFGFNQNDQHEYLVFLFRMIHDNMNIRAHMNFTGEVLNEYDALEKQALQVWRMDGMSTTIVDIKKDNTDCYDSCIPRMFCGQYHFRTMCEQADCKHVSNLFDVFRCCELPIGNPDKDIVTLDESLAEFTGIIQLDSDNPSTCDKCGHKGRSLRKQTFWRLPPVLVISLKRNMFYQTEGGAIRSLKDKRLVQFPQTLDLAPYMSAHREASVYQLYATGNHRGGPNGGHHYSQVRSEKDDKWYTINDKHVMDGLPSTQEDAYMLFYRLK